MQSKTIPQLDEQGYFAGFAVADESPLEPGVFLLPAGAIDAEPPQIAPGQRAKWDGATWVFEDVPAPAPAPAQVEQPAPAPAQVEQPAPDPKWEIQNQIHALEAQVTRRRLREALLTGDTSFVAAIDAQIAVLRAQL